MNCYVGYIIPSPPNYNRGRYALALNEISDYLNLQAQQNSQLVLSQTQSLLTLRLSCSSFTIIKNPNFLHTAYYQITISSQQQLQFLKICLQCLLIIKEYSVSQIQLQITTQNEQFKPKLQQLERERNQELSRRLVSQLKNLSQQSSNISNAEIQDLLYIIDKSINRKLTMLSLKILNSNRVHSQEWEKLKKPQIQIIERLGQDAQAKKYCKEILQKISQSKKSVQQNNYYLNIQTDRNFIKDLKQPQNKSSRVQLQQAQHAKFSISSSLKSIFFQLKQSRNLERINFLISSMQLQDLDKNQLFKMDKYLREVGQRILKQFYSCKQSEQQCFLELYGQYLNFRSTNIPEQLIRKLIKRSSNSVVIAQFNQALTILEMERNTLKVSQVGIKMEQSLMDTAKDYIQKI